MTLAAAPDGAISTAPWFAELRSSPPRFAVLFLTLLEMAQSQTVRLEQRHPEADLLVAPTGS
jgi:chromatin segregation and condensation protein Rec8/ScpA/Scc1 (kleisin family)